MKLKKVKGFSLIEVLVAIGVFSIVALVTTQSLASSLRNSRKSDAISRSRQNVDYAISTMERLLRNAQDISCSGDNRTLNYVDEFGNNSSFRCAGDHIASGSARLTSNSVLIDCSARPVFTCSVAGPTVPEAVEIILTAEDALMGNTEEGATVTSKTKVLLRNY